MTFNKREKKVLIIFFIIVLVLLSATLIINVVRANRGEFTKLVINYKGEDVAEISVSEIRDIAIDFTAYDGTVYSGVQLISILASKEVFAMGDAKVFVANIDNTVMQYPISDVITEDMVYIAIGADGEEFDKSVGSFKLIDQNDNTRFMNYVIYIEVVE